MAIIPNIAVLAPKVFTDAQAITTVPFNNDGKPFFIEAIVDCEVTGILRDSENTVTIVCVAGQAKLDFMKEVTTVTPANSIVAKV